MKSIVPANWLPEPAVRLALHRRKTRTTRDKSRSVYEPLLTFFPDCSWMTH